MGNISREVIKSALGTPWEENPLKVIGLTRHVLRLGLTEDALYLHATRIVQALLLQYHPDRNHSQEALLTSQKFGEVQHFLKDRERFRAALADLRAELADDRREERTLKERIHMLETSLRLQSGRLGDVQAALAESEAAHQRLKKAASLERLAQYARSNVEYARQATDMFAVRVRGRYAMTPNELGYVAVLDLEFREPVEQPDPILTSGDARAKKAAKEKARRRRSIPPFDLQTISVALRSRQQIPVFEHGWLTRLFKETGGKPAELVYPRKFVHSRAISPLEEFEDIVPVEQQEQVTRNYREALQAVQRELRRRNSRIGSFGATLRVYRVEQGKLKMDGRLRIILGSIPTQVLGEQAYRGSSSLRRMDVVLKLKPWATIDSILVTQPLRDIDATAESKDAELKVIRSHTNRPHRTLHSAGIVVGLG